MLPHLCGGSGLNSLQRSGRAGHDRLLYARGTAVLRAQAQQNTHSLFNRSEELAALTQKVSFRPKCITVLTGPSDSGKTAILQEVVRRLSSPAISTSKQQVFLTIDCREGYTTSPAGFAKHLAASAADVVVGDRSLLSILAQFGVRANDGTAGFSLEASIAPSEAATALDRIITLLMKWLRSWQGPPYPVLIIDEANRLKDWQDERALQVLLDFLVVITKQHGLCHVVLGTSDSFFTDWLEQRKVRHGHFIKMELGDLTEQAIKECVYGGSDQTSWPGMLERVKVDPAGLKAFTLPEALWSEAYGLLGGNIGAWNVAVSEAAEDFAAHDLEQLEASWQRVFGATRVATLGFMERPFGAADRPPTGRESPRWTPQQWGQVLETIADAPEPHHAVPYSDLCATAGEVAVVSLIKHNYLTLRTRSALAQDLPAAVFQGEYAVVTAPFQAALAYIKTRAWQARVPPASTADHSAGLSRPPSGTFYAVRESHNG